MKTINRFMVTTSGLRLDARHVIGFFLLIAISLLPLPAQAQPVPRPPFGQGTHALRALLKQMGLQPISDREEYEQLERSDPSRILVFALGRSELPARLDQLLDRGIAVMLATDNHWSWPGLEVSGNFVRIDPKSPEAYRGSAECPLVEPVPNARIPIFAGLSCVATNRPSCLLLEPNSWLVPLARFPKECSLQDVDMPFKSRTFAAAAEVGENRGRFLILADHSVFINDMMIQPDNDNIDLAYRAISWLTEPINGKRDRVLFLEDGEIVSNFNVSLRQPPPPALPSDGEVIQAMNRMLAGLDRENYYNRQLLRQISPTAWPNDQPDLQRGRARLWAWLIGFLTIGLAFLAIRRLRQTRHAIDPKEPLLEAELKSSAPALRWSNGGKE